jgi:hypothetical protein
VKAPYRDGDGFLVFERPGLGRVRAALGSDGEPRFVQEDVCRALGITEEAALRALAGVALDDALESLRLRLAAEGLRRIAGSPLCPPGKAAEFRAEAEEAERALARMPAPGGGSPGRRGLPDAGGLFSAGRLRRTPRGGFRMGESTEGWKTERELAEALSAELGFEVTPEEVEEILLAEGLHGSQDKGRGWSVPAGPCRPGWGGRRRDD